MEHAQVYNEAQIGRYSILRKLGEGGMARTWLCQLDGAHGFQRKVVVKSPRPDSLDDDHITMFTDEARVGVMMEHPNIPRVTELGFEGKLPYMVQEFVEGPSLTRITRRMRKQGVIDPVLATQVCSAIARALHYAHTTTDEHGAPLSVVHRDISLSNVLISEKGRPKLIDFGVATWSDREARTQVGVVKGKLRYLAPELLVGDKPTHRSDLYALGVVLYITCCGKSPWGADQSIMERAAGSYTPITEHMPDLPEALVSIIDRLLSLEPRDRFRTGSEVALALDGWLRSAGHTPGDEGYIAAALRTLFPEGRKGWQHISEPGSLNSLPSQPSLPSLPSQPTDAPQPTATGTPIPRQSRSVLALGAGVILLAGVGLAALVGVFVLDLGRQPAAPAPVTEAADPVEPLLQSAEAALQAGDLSEAATRLMALDGLELTDSEQRTRRSHIERELKVASGSASALLLLESSPEQAMAAAIALDQAYPAHPDVAALIATITEAVRPTAPDEPDAAGSPAAPAPREPTPRRTGPGYDMPQPPVPVTDDAAPGPAETISTTGLQAPASE